MLSAVCGYSGAGKSTFCNVFVSTNKVNTLDWVIKTLRWNGPQKTIEDLLKSQNWVPVPEEVKDDADHKTILTSRSGKKIYVLAFADALKKILAKLTGISLRVFLANTAEDRALREAITFNGHSLKTIMRKDLLLTLKITTHKCGRDQ